MESLFDFSFNKFLAPKIVGVLYGIGMFFAGLVSLSLLAVGFRGGILSGVGTLIVSPIVFLLYIVMIRVGLEGLIATIKVAESSQVIAQHTRQTADNTSRLP